MGVNLREMHEHQSSFFEVKNPKSLAFLRHYSK